MLFGRFFSKPEMPSPHAYGKVGQEPTLSLHGTDATRQIGKIHDPLLQDLCCFWDRKRRGRFAPSPEDIDPAEIADLLPSTIFVTVTQSPLNLDCAIVGDEVADHVGQDLAGSLLFPQEQGVCLTLSQVWALTCLTSELLFATRQRKPHYAEGGYTDAVKSFKSVRRLVLPFSTDGETIPLLLVGLAFDGAAPVGGHAELAKETHQGCQ